MFKRVTSTNNRFGGSSTLAVKPERSLLGSFQITKRHKIIIVSVLLFFGFLFVTQPFVIFYRRHFFILALGAIAYILSLWALWEGMSKTKAIILLILPTFYCLAFTSFYFLFRDIRWLTRLPMAVIFGLSYYLLLLSQNVFSVASSRAIPLYRAASSTSLVYTVTTCSLLLVVIFSFELPFYWNALLTAFLIFPLFLQTLWSVKMEGIDSKIVVYSIGLSLLVGECALALSFWGDAPLVKSLYLASIIYSLLGIVVEFTRDRLTNREVMEYTFVGMGSFLSILVISTVLMS